MVVVGTRTEVVLWLALACVFATGCAGPITLEPREATGVSPDRVGVSYSSDSRDIQCLPQGGAIGAQQFSLQATYEPAGKGNQVTSGRLRLVMGSCFWGVLFPLPDDVLAYSLARDSSENRAQHGTVTLLSGLGSMGTITQQYRLDWPEQPDESKPITVSFRWHDFVGAQERSVVLTFLPNRTVTERE